MGIPFVGEIRMFSGNYAPQNWALCNGQLLPIAENETLFQLIGTTYGGDGETHFALPDMRGRIPIHMGKNSSSSTSYLLGQNGGVEQVTLTLDQLPKHTHVPSGNLASGDQESPENNIWASSGKQFSNREANADMNSSLISSVGGNQSHDNMMPSLGVTFIISLFGIYPSQT